MMELYSLLVAGIDLNKGGSKIKGKHFSRKAFMVFFMMMWFYKEYVVACRLQCPKLFLL